MTGAMGVMGLASGLIFERLSCVTLLGLRFWDVALSEPVTSGLRVSASPKGRPSPAVAATSTRSGAYAFMGLPGLRDLEFGAGDAAYWQASANVQREFTVRVTDGEGRFSPLRFDVRAPSRGFFGPGCDPTALVVGAPAGAIPLFSSATRPAPAGMAVVRAELRDPNGAKPRAAWALVEARVKGQATVLGRGLADEGGRLALFLPYPDLGDALQPNDPMPLMNRAWEVEFRARFANLPTDDAPDLCQVLTQPAASLLPLPGAAVTLAFGRELILK